MALVDNLIENWTLDSTRSGSLGSITLTANSGGGSFVSSKINNGISFPGTANVYERFTYNTAIPAGTIAFWHKTTANGTGNFHRTFAKTQVGVTDVIVIGFNNYGRRPSLNIQDTSIILEASDVLTRDTMYHHAITWNGTTVKWYINGTESYSVSSTKTVQSNTNQYTIGGWSGNSNQQGVCEMDEIGMWSRALTSTEVSQLYNGGNGLQYPFTIVSTPSRLLMMGVG